MISDYIVKESQDQLTVRNRNLDYVLALPFAVARIRARQKVRKRSANRSR